MANRKSNAPSALDFAPVAEKETPSAPLPAQEELERTVSLLNATLESIADGIVVVDLAGKTVAFNQKFLEMWNLPEELVESEKTQERLAFLARQVKKEKKFLNRIQELSNRPELEGYDVVELKDGRVFERYAKPQWAGNKIIGRVWNFRDITEQQRAEAVLRRNEASMAAAQRIAHVGNWDTDITTGELYWSDEIYRIFGLTPQEFDATVDGFFSRVHPDDLEYVLKEADEAYKGHKSYNVNHRIIRANGEIGYVHQEAEVTFDETGQPLRMLGIVRDVTEQKRLELQIQRSLARRERYIQLATRVALETAAATDLTDLYRRVVNRVKEQSDFFHVQLFRYEAGTETLALAAGYGVTGEKMLNERYRLPLGSGPVGAAAALGGTVLLANTVTEPDWQPHPDLPETQGEMAVPIKLGQPDGAAQAMALDYFVNNDFDGFIVCVVDPESVVPVTQVALAKGVRVVTQSIDLGNDNQTTYLGAEEYETGYLLGQQAGAWAKRHIPAHEVMQVGLFNHRAIAPVVQREAGIIAGLEATFGSNFEVVANETGANPATSRPLAERWLKTYPKLRMILAINDAGALGAYQAAKVAGKNNPDQFFIGGIDGIDEAIAALAEGGVFQATVDKSAYVEGRVALKTLIATIVGQPYQEKTVIKTRPINRANLAEISAERQDQSEADAFAGFDLSGIKIGLSVMNLNNPFFATFAQVVTQEAKRLGVKLVINDPKPVLGVLNIHTNKADTLDLEDQLALEGVCSQVAVAIESIRLRQEMEDKLHELNTLQHLMSREGWQAFHAAREQDAPGYIFDQTVVRPLTDSELRLPGNSVSTSANGYPLVTKSLAVQGEIIGALGIQDQPDEPLALEDEAFLAAVTEQVAEALERARLLEQAQKRAVEMETVAQVSAAASSLLNTAELLQKVADLTKERFGLYHAHIYLLNERGDMLDLAAGAGEIGQQMMTQGWSIPLNREHSLVAQAARTRQAVIVDDVRRNPNFMPNPLLPNTRSEMAIPLVIGESLLGVLDVQAEVSNRFTEEDKQVQTTFAAQVAVALRNANLYQQTQAALLEREQLLAEVEQTQRRYTVQGWETYRSKHIGLNYEQIREGVSVDELSTEASQLIEQAQTADGRPQESGNSSLVVPLNVRGETIGVLGLQEIDEQRVWSPEELALIEAISVQLAQAAENIRLIDESQQQAAREKRVNEIGEKIGAAQSLEEALKIAISEVGLSLQAPKTTVKLEVK